MNVAIIPARGGSKRIPRKNIRLFAGKPIIAYSIETAIVSGLFDRVIVSTDDNEIAEVAARYGAEVPFRRPPELADDDASTDAVLLHALAVCVRLYGSAEYGCCVYPTTPLLTSADLMYGLDLLRKHHATSSFPIVKYVFPIEQAFVFDGIRPRAKWPAMLSARSQDLEDHYHDAGMFYWFDVTKFVRAGQLFCEDCVAFPVAESRCQDINTLEDWALAELKFRTLPRSGDVPVP